MAKVVAAAWRMELIQFLAALVILHQDDLKKRTNRITALTRIDASKKWIIIRFTPYQTITLRKWMFSKKLFFRSLLLLKG